MYFEITGCSTREEVAALLDMFIECCHGALLAGDIDEEMCAELISEAHARANSWVKPSRGLR